MKIYIGIDWSENKHDVAFLNEAGAHIARLTIGHTVSGFTKLEATRQKLGVSTTECLVGLETAHNLLIDFLWGQGYSHVYVIPPHVTRGSRCRYGNSGARTDQTDARLLADLLRTDLARLRPWCPDSALTRQMRAKASLVLYLTRNRLRYANRLRAVLLRYYPAALKLFSKLTNQITLEFIRAYPTPQVAARLTLAEFEQFTLKHRYNRRSKVKSLFARLQQPQPMATVDTVSVYEAEAVLLATLLLDLVKARYRVQTELTSLFQLHPDFPIFNSLPGAGKLLAPALLVKFGDDRRRFPSAAGVQALAGTCPITSSSGKRKQIRFRSACDREFRYIAQEWAMQSRDRSVWASAYYQRKRDQGCSRSHAYRCLANRWLAIAWKLWQTRQPYDEGFHLQQRAKRGQPIHQ